MYISYLFIIIQILQLVIECKAVEPEGYIITLDLDKQQIDSIQTHIDKVRELFNQQEGSDLEIGKNEIGYVYNKTLPGYSAKLSQIMLEKIRAMKEVAYIEEDREYSINAIQYNAPWGLARLSYRGSFNTDYQFDERGGEGVAVYVIDTGININHVEFQGRAYWGANMVYGTPNRDENGHGTHCAGTVGSYNYGVAKRANLVAVKVLNANGRGDNSGIIAGIDWAVNHAFGQKGNVINLSLGGGYSNALNYAVRRAVQLGFVVSVAAGNDNIDACTVSPASEPSVITVGAIAYNNNRASFSNWGSCLNIFAPGDQILSTYSTSNYATNYMSGTSMASPHVAGLAAHFLTKYPRASPSKIQQLINYYSLKGVVGYPGYGSPNTLLNNGGF